MRASQTISIRPPLWLLLLAAIVLTSGILGSLMLNRGHVWGDDFAEYIMQARALVEGNPRDFILHNSFTIDQSPVTIGLTSYPWGFPLLLAPAYGVLGANFLAFKLELTIVYMAFLVAFYLLARTRLPPVDSLLLMTVMAFNSTLLGAQNDIMSDLPFLLWSTLALWLIERYFSVESSRLQSRGGAVAVGTVIFMAAFTRLNGWLLLVPLAVAQLMRTRSTPPLEEAGSSRLANMITPYLAFAVLFGLQAALLPSVMGGLAHAFDALTVSEVLHQAAYYLVLPGRFLEMSGIGGLGLYGVLLIFVLMRLATRRQQDVPLVLYSAATLALYIAFPQIQGPRFIYPLLPILFLFAYDGLREVASRLPRDLRDGSIIAIRMAWAALAVVSLLVSVGGAVSNLAADRAVNAGPFTPAAQAMFSFVRKSTPGDGVVAFFKPRAMRLFTGRDSFVAINCKGLSQGDFLVLMRDQGGYNQIPPSDVGDCASVRLSSVFTQENIEVFRISSPP